MGARVGFLRGEIQDALPAAAAPMFVGDKRVMPQANILWMNFLNDEDPDFRDLESFDFVVRELKTLGREHRQTNARVTRSALIHQGLAAGRSRSNLSVAVRMLVMCEHLEEQDGVLCLTRKGFGYPLPKDQRNQAATTGRALRETKPMRARTHPHVVDVIKRRTDGRPASAEPFEALASELDKLKLGQFRAWWEQTTDELRRRDPFTNPVSCCVLSAALIEGALTFVVRHARDLKLAPFQSSKFDGNPRTWKIVNPRRVPQARRDRRLLVGEVSSLA